MAAEVWKWGAQVLEIIGRKCWRKCGGSMFKSLISLKAEAEAEVHTTYAAPLEAARHLRICRGAR